MVEIEIRFDGKKWIVETAGVSITFSTLTDTIIFLLNWFIARAEKREQEGL